MHPEESVGGQREQHRERDRGAAQVRTRPSAGSLSDPGGVAVRHARTYRQSRSTQRVTQRIVSVETVGLCGGNVSSKEDRAYF